MLGALQETFEGFVARRQLKDGCVGGDALEFSEQTIK